MPLPAPTERLEFRRWSRNDEDLATSLWGDPEVMRFLGGPYSPEEVSARIDREMANDDAHGIQYWPLFTRDSGEFAGCCGLKPYRPAESLLELGFHLRPPFWRAGYATEAAGAVVAFAFELLGAAALYAGSHPQNAASAALLSKLGFTRIGTHFFDRTGLDHSWWELKAKRPPR
jgi:[ribosomal protein S5]-alanine N-acetyltransferase